MARTKGKKLADTPRRRIARAELRLIGKVVTRMLEYAEANAIPLDETRIGLTAMFSCAKRYHPTFDLEKLLSFDDFNFVHDAFGLYKTLDHTGQIHNHFLPRCMRHVGV